MKEVENFLSFGVVWKDDHLLELEFAVSNNGFTGIARGYDTAGHLEALAQQLEGFPRDDQSILYELKESMPHGKLSITFCRIALSGLVGVNVYLESGGERGCQNSKVSLELIVEPNSIDVFQKCLAALTVKQEGAAKLIAR